MKTLTIICLAVIVVVACLLSSYEHAKIAEFDKNFQQNLAGTWSSALDNMRLTNVVTIGGSFSCYLMFIYPDHTNTYQETGNWMVKNREMIETVKSDTNPSARAPRSHFGQIIQANPHEFAVRWQNSPDEWVWQKAIQ